MMKYYSAIKREQISNTCYNLSGSTKYFAENMKSYTQGYILSDCIHIAVLKLAK